MRSIANILNSDRILEISQANTLGKSLEYFLYYNEEDLPTVAYVIISGKMLTYKYIRCIEY